MKFGIQLYNFRRFLAEDFEGTMQKISQLGFEGAEVVVYRGPLTPAEYAAYLQKLNLQCCGAMYEPARLTDPADSAYEYVKAMKSPAVTISSWSENFASEWQQQAELLQKIGQAAAANGVVFSYHNHWDECVKVDGDAALCRMLDANDPAQVFAEPDICWLNRGGLNGAEFITRYAGRIRQVHFKDIRIADDIKTTVPLGTGIIDLKSAYEAAKAANVEWIIYEQDNSEDPFADAAKSLEYLKSL